MYWQNAAWAYLTFAVATFAVAAPLLFVEYGVANERFRRWAWWYRHVAVSLALCLAVVLAVRYLAIARSLIESVDFFHYVVSARDLVHGGENSLLSRVAYFPGVYRSWEAVMALFGEELSTLQWAFVGVLGANALLVAAIVARAIHSVAAGVLAALWFVALASQLEGLYGTTEPIATLFALAGVLCWGGKPLRGSAGWVRAALLGAGLGLALWTKQQAGLIAVGGAGFLVTQTVVQDHERHDLWQVAAVPIAATAVFLIAILFEGEGLRPIRDGIGLLAQYDTEGSFYDNLRLVVRRIGLPALGAMLALLLWGGTLMIPRLRRIHSEPSAAIVGFALLASAASFIQFSKRPYAHYALLSAPFLAVATVIVGVRILQAISATKLRAASFARIAIVCALAAPLVAWRPDYPYFHVWPPQWNPQVAHEIPWHQNADVASDLRALHALVRPGETLFILPPRRNAVHFLLGTRSMPGQGYGWGAGAIPSTLLPPTLEAILVLDGRTFDETDINTCDLWNCQRVAAALPANGFSKIATLNTMVLWRRNR
jgi:hypothetical protein